MVRHVGGCHCGKVRFEVTAPASISVVDCNCSMCSKSGYLHLIVPKSRFRLLQGEDVLTTYTFNTGVAKHLFCSICGVKSFYVPRSHPDGYSVNARCLDPGTVESMTIEPFNGSEWESSIAKVEKHSSMDKLAEDPASMDGLAEDRAR
jgi:centromere protein V